MTMPTTKNKKSNYNSNKSNIKTCNYCKKKRHLESNCFKKYSNLKDKSINNTTKEETILTSSIVNKDNSNNCKE